MRNLRTLCMAVVLALAFASHSFAGIIGSPPEPPPPPANNLAVTIVLTLVQIAAR